MLPNGLLEHDEFLATLTASSKVATDPHWSKNLPVDREFESQFG